MTRDLGSQLSNHQVPIKFLLGGDGETQGMQLPRYYHILMVWSWSLHPKYKGSAPISLLSPDSLWRDFLLPSLLSLSLLSRHNNPW